MRRQALVLDSEDLLPAAGARWSGRGAGNQSGAGGGGEHAARTRGAGRILVLVAKLPNPVVV